MRKLQNRKALTSPSMAHKLIVPNNVPEIHIEVVVEPKNEEIKAEVTEDKKKVIKKATPIVDTKETKEEIA